MHVKSYYINVIYAVHDGSSGAFICGRVPECQSRGWVNILSDIVDRLLIVKGVLLEDYSDPPEGYSRMSPFRNVGNFVHPTFACVFRKILKPGSPFYLVYIYARGSKVPHRGKIRNL